jgi:hypothetical protein
VRLDRAEAAAVLLLGLMLFAPTALPIGVSLAVSPEDIESGRVVLTSACPARARGGTCGACGLTRGFAAMSRGRVGDARAYNAAAPTLYGGTLCTALASGALVAAALARLFARRRPPGLRSA